MPLFFKHCTYDLTALLLSMLETRSLKEVVEIPTKEMIYRLRLVQSCSDINPKFKDAVRCVLEAVGEVARLNLKPVDDVQLRQVRKRRAILIKRLMVLNLRDHLAFAPYVRIRCDTT